MILDFNYENRQKMLKEWASKAKTLRENKKHMLYFGWPTKQKERKEEQNVKPT